MPSDSNTQPSKGGLWVGKFNDAQGSLFVFDPELNSKDSQSVYLYALKSSRLEKHERAILKPAVSRVKSDGPRAYVIRIYTHWRGTVRSKFLEFGRPAREGNPRPHRSTHCWNCKTPIDNRFDIECRVCLWIICPSCGACEITGSHPPSSQSPSEPALGGEDEIPF